METAGDLLFEPIKNAVKKFAFEEPASIVKIVPTFLGEDAIVMELRLWRRGKCSYKRRKEYGDVEFKVTDVVIDGRYCSA